MAEMERLAEVLIERFHEDPWMGHSTMEQDCFHCREFQTAALSWLASVLADDATVRTVAEALEDATIQYLGRDLGTAHRDEIAAHALAALSAHLTAPARAGDTSGEEGP